VRVLRVVELQRDGETPRFTTLTTADGLSSDQATCITEDSAGFIYLGTGRGVDRLDPETGYIKQYTTADGLPDNFIIVSFRDHSGALWFGTLRGLARLLPEPVQSRQAPPILISRLVAGDSPQPISELGVTELSNIELVPSANRLQAEFLSLSFNPGEKLRYQYPNATGTAAFGNDKGIFIAGGSVANKIGDAAANTGNVISGNHGVGVALSGNGTMLNEVFSNLIGTRADGVNALGNASHGVQISQGANGNYIGSFGAGAANIIAYNGANGAQHGSGVRLDKDARHRQQHQRQLDLL
jgi:hypothetical protein